MDFLGILPISRFIFELKMKFCNYFSVFKHLWTGPHFSESPGASAENSLDSVYC
jgi:hypothetical protein